MLHCDVCGFEWIKKQGKIPEQCPSSRCRSRKWNSKADLLTEKPPKESSKTGRKRKSSHGGLLAQPTQSAGSLVTVVFTSTPSGADIEVDGVYLGSTSAELPLGIGERSLRITKKGYSPLERKLQILAGGKQRVSAELELASQGRSPRRDSAWEPGTSAKHKAGRGS